MAYNSRRAEQVRQLLKDVPVVSERKMFGSDGFLINGKLSIGVGDHSDHVMMVRVGKDRYEEALQQNGAHPAIMRGREMKGYIFLTKDALRKEADMKYWVDMAISFASIQ